MMMVATVAWTIPAGTIYEQYWSQTCVRPVFIAMFWHVHRHVYTGIHVIVIIALDVCWQAWSKSKLLLMINAITIKFSTKWLYKNEL